MSHSKAVGSSDSEQRSAFPLASSLGKRLAFFFVLAMAELPLLAFLFQPGDVSRDPNWVMVRDVLRQGVPLSLFFFVSLVLVLTPKRQSIFAEWKHAALTHHWKLPLVVNLVVFLVLLVVTPFINTYGAAQSEPPWLLFGLWILSAFFAYGALVLAMAPAFFWRQFLDAERIWIAVAAGAAMLVGGMSYLSQQSWSILSEATFHLTAFFLSLYEGDVTTILDERIIGIGDFEVNIAAACSGYEGIGLVATFLALYLWMFRADLKFPNVLLMFPVGIGAIWTLNSVRIVALLSIGAHVSPNVAMTGFHSQAGWMMFLLVTIGILIATHHIPFFNRNEKGETVTDASPRVYEATAFLSPFLAMTAAGILAVAFSSGGYWLYSFRVTALLLAFFAFWKFYRGIDWRAGFEPIAIGALVGVGWIITDPGRGEASDLGLWLNGLAPAVFIVWVTLRTIGTVILVPLAEEMAFRGYLHRKLIADRFDKVAEGTFTWKAFIVSTVLFGAIHGRWLSGAIAGALFALALYRSGKLSGAIIAHMVANAVIAVWAISMGQWSLF